MCLDLGSKTLATLKVFHFHCFYQILHIFSIKTTNDARPILFHHQYHKREESVKFRAEKCFFFLSELVPGSKTFIFLPGT